MRHKMQMRMRMQKSKSRGPPTDFTINNAIRFAASDAAMLILWNFRLPLENILISLNSLTETTRDRRSRGIDEVRFARGLDIC